MDNRKLDYVQAMIELIYLAERDIITSSNQDKNEDDDGWTGV